VDAAEARAERTHEPAGNGSARRCRQAFFSVEPTRRSRRARPNGAHAADRPRRAPAGDPAGRRLTAPEPGTLRDRADAAQGAPGQPRDLGGGSRAHDALVRRQEHPAHQGRRVRGRRSARSDRELRRRRRRLECRRRGARRAHGGADRRYDGSRIGLAARAHCPVDQPAAQGRGQVGAPRRRSVRREERGHAVAVRVLVHSQRSQAHLFADLRDALGPSPGRASPRERHRRAEERHRRDGSRRDPAPSGGHEARRRGIEWWLPSG
jgi:hypothetical protein